MKTYKKLLVGLGALMVILPSVFMFINGPKVQAAPSGVATNPLDIKRCMGSAKFINISEIDCTFTPVDGSKDITIHFVNSHPDAGNGGDCGSLGFDNSCPDEHNFTQQESFFINGDRSSSCAGQSQSNNHCENDPGITVQRESGKFTGSLYQADAGTQLNLIFNLKYRNSGGQEEYPCQNFTETAGCSRDKDHLSSTDDIKSYVKGSRTENIDIFLKFDGQNAVSLDNVTDGWLNGLSYGLDSTYDAGKDGPLIFTSGFAPNPCSGDILIVTTSPTFKANRFVLTDKNEDLSTNYPRLLAYLNFANASGCGVDHTTDQSNGNQKNFFGIDTPFRISGTVPKLSDGSGKGGTKDETPADGSSDGSCGGPSSALNWITCPLLLSAQAATNGLLDSFEKLLSFNVDQDLGNKNDQASVKKTWSLVRNLATAFLVIIMLIMVFSQAISTGPFDAYTVRKMLPRLIIVAIAIQLSWAIVAWVIGIFDDLGKGIADIMYLPFGGVDKLNLPNLLDHAGFSMPGGAAGGLAINGIVLVLAVALGVATLPATLLLLLGGVAALFTAYFTLIIRKIIIIVLLIFAPIAMLAYVLPNTQKYWKMWYDNLTKILLMFPLIMIMISVGRIFAYIAGGQGGNHTGGVLNFILVMVAFFGPLFLLPKTYKWGGQAMSIMSGAVGGISNRYLGRESALGKGLQGFGERTQGQIARGYDPSAKRRFRIMRRIGSGHILPTPRSRRLAIAAGDKWANDRNDEATALNTRIGEMARNGYDRRMKDKKGYYRLARRNGQYVDKDGNLTADRTMAAKEYVSKENAEVERLIGIEAEKQAYVDNTGKTGSDANKRLAKAAHLKLLETHSEIEMQNAFVQGGEFDGKRVFETETYDPTLQGSPQHYGLANDARPDLTPDVKQGALADLKARGAVRKDLTYKNATPEETKLLDAERLSTALSRLKPEDLQKAHYGMMQDIASVGDQVVTWKDETGTVRTAKLAEQLEHTLRNMAEKGGQPGNVAIGSLRGGRERYVNEALKEAGVSLDDIHTS